MEKIFRRVISIVISCLLVCNININLNIFAETENTVDENSSSIYTEIISYSEYYDIYSSKNRPECEVIINGADYKIAENGDFSVGDYGNDVDDIRENVLIWDSSDGYISYDVDIPETGIYCFNLNYFPIPANNNSIELSMQIDGVTPYDTASRLIFNKIWINETDIIEDSRGNQIRPSQIQYGKWCSEDAKDVDGLFSQPLIFYLEKGTHEISFQSERANFVIENFKFYQPEKIKSYSEYLNSISDLSIGEEDNIIRIEGENALYKTSSSLYPTYDNSSYLVSPSSTNSIVYNTIGDDNWNNVLQSITWVIPADEIKNDGWYKIGIKARQDEKRGFYSSRRIYIDGEVLCEELNQVDFYYDTDWDIISPQNENDYIYIYLTADCDHTFTMEAVANETGEYFRQLDEIVSELNIYYRKIIMITGAEPDKYTDYYVHEKIPNLLDKFTEISSELKEIRKGLENLNGSSSSETAVIERMTAILDKCVKKPLKIPQYLSEIKDNITAVSSWERECREQPLEIDYIELCTANVDFSDVEENFLKSLSFGFKTFIGSFFTDYSTISDVSGDDVIEVWVNSGREQAQVIKEMTESQFMQEYPDIAVSVNLVSGGIVEASLSGNAPDVALFLGGEFPVNLASRGLLTDLSEFDDYDDVKMRFQENATVSYEFNGGTYGLPLTQNWAMMFYRTDILSELGFENPPETWQDLIDMLPAIQRNYMSVGLVLPSTDISPSTETGHTFASLMLQNGLNYYNDEQTKSNFDLPTAVSAFETWTDFYTKYSFTQSYDAFSRFRTGEYPIVIANYTFFNQLTEVAPEIQGLWNFTSIPATVRDDGTLSHAENSNGTCAVIFEKTVNKENAWKYIKWFTETETQVEYGTKTEGLLGIMGRLDTANTEALKQLSWSSGELERLFAQRNELVEIPIIPSSYAVTRNIMNAFRAVVNNGENPRDALVWYNIDINEEIRRKNENMRT